MKFSQAYKKLLAISLEIGVLLFFSGCTLMVNRKLDYGYLSHMLRTDILKTLGEFFCNKNDFQLLLTWP